MYSNRNPRNPVAAFLSVLGVVLLIVLVPIDPLLSIVGIGLIIAGVAVAAAVKNGPKNDGRTQNPPTYGNPFAGAQPYAGQQPYGQPRGNAYGSWNGGQAQAPQASKYNPDPSKWRNLEGGSNATRYQTVRPQGGMDTFTTDEAYWRMKDDERFWNLPPEKAPWELPPEKDLW